MLRLAALFGASRKTCRKSKSTGRRSRLGPMTSDTGFVTGSILRLAGNSTRSSASPRIRVNSLHSQLIDKLAPSLVVEATADDGSVEAVTVRDAKGFNLAVVFHPEYWAERDEASHAILQAFAAAVRGHARGRSFVAAAE